jgi:ribosome-binding protein aMBF1 (putative translation factor)
MGLELNPGTMSDAELLERYLSARVEIRRSWLEVQRAESHWLSHPTSESLADLRAARDAWSHADRGDALGIEIERRLNAPLKSTREEKGLSQGELAQRVGLTRRDIKGYESGRHWAGFRECIRMWEVLGLELPKGWEILGETDGV